MWYLFVAIICAFPLIILWIGQKWSNFDVKLNLPGPKAYPIIGSLMELKSFISERKMYLKILEYCETYGDTFRVRVGPKLIIFTRDLKVIEHIASDPKFIKGHEYKALLPFVGNGLLTSSGNRWFNLRKLITPAFHFQILERFIPIYEEQAEILSQKIGDKLGEIVDVAPMFHNMALDIIAETGMGVKLKAQSGLHHEFVEANAGLLDIFTQRMNNGFLTIEWIFRLTPLYKKQNNWLNTINSFVNEIIEKRRSELIDEMKNNESMATNDEKSQKRRPALLELLLQSELDGKPLTNDEIRNEVKTFMLAGHETTSNALGFLCYILAKYPNIQDRVMEELKSLINPSEPLTIKDLNSLTYLDCVVKETLRHFPAGSMLPKRCLDDVTIGNVFIPADTTIMTLIYGLHMNEKNFKDCKKFDPDRWIEEVTVEDRNPYAYQPFSSGLRNCIGQRFALLEIKTVAIKLLNKFSIELADKEFIVDVIESGAMKSRNGVPLKFIPRMNN